MKSKLKEKKEKAGSRAKSSDSADSVEIDGEGLLTPHKIPNQIIAGINAHTITQQSFYNKMLNASIRSPLNKNLQPGKTLSPMKADISAKYQRKLLLLEKGK